MNIESFNDAVRKGDIERVERAINDENRSFALEELDQRGNRPIHYSVYAAERRCVAIVKLLLENGANPNIPDCNGSLPFHWKYVLQNPEILDLFLSHGADVNARGHQGDTLLHLALTHHSELRLVEKLLKLKADVNALNDSGNSPLARALGCNCYCGYNKADQEFEIARLLIDHGANVHVGSSPFASPLYKAITYKSVKFVELVAKVGSKSGRKFIFREHILATLFHGSEDKLECLLDNGADLHEGNENSTYYLIIAYVVDNIKRDRHGNHNFGIVKLLMEHGLRVGENDRHVLKKEAFLTLIGIQRELDSVKVTKVCDDFQTTFSDFLENRGSSLVRRLGNEKIREILKSGEYEGKFVHFSDKLKRNIDCGLKRYDKAEPVFGILCEIFGKILPAEVICMIVEFFNNDELDFFIKNN